MGAALAALLSRVRRIGGAGDLVVGALAVTSVAGPVLFGSNGFSKDFTNELWLVWVAGHHLGHSLWPSFFLHLDPGGPTSGVFDPEFAFYGGPLYAAAGAVSALLSNDATTAFALMSVIALSCAYGGCWWLARQCGVRGLLAHVPAIVMLTSAYYSTDLYGRGDWSEFMGVSSIPMVAASVIDLLRAPRLRVRSVLLLIGSVYFFTGSHNITLAWGTALLGVLALVLFAAYRPPIPWRRVLTVAVLVLLAAGVNGWFLLPDVYYAGRTAIGKTSFSWGMTSFFDTIGVVLNPLRVVPSPSSTPALYVQAPVWFMAWGALAGALLWRSRAMRGLRRAWVALAAGIILLLWLLLYQWPWEHIVPHPLRFIQFAYRLDSYLTLLSVGLVIVGVVALQRLTRLSSRNGAPSSIGALWSLRALLLEAVIVSVILCVWQLTVPNTHQTPAFYKNRGEALRSTTSLPSTWGSEADYADNSQRSIENTNGRKLEIPARQINAAGDHFSGDVQAPAGLAPIATNILAGPYLVNLSGVHVLGRTGPNLVVMRVHPGSGKIHITISTQSSPAIVLGRLMSAASVLILACLLAWLGVGRRLRRRGVSPPWRRARGSSRAATAAAPG